VVVVVVFRAIKLNAVGRERKVQANDNKRYFLFLINQKTKKLTLAINKKGKAKPNSAGIAVLLGSMYAAMVAKIRHRLTSTFVTNKAEESNDRKELDMLRRMGVVALF
jgi:hypothetical protein